MAKLFMFEKPAGMRDTLPHLFQFKETIRQRLMEETMRFGYRFLETPTIEYYETVGKVSATLDRQLFKLLDQDGRSLVLRPDMTAPIARVAASHFLKEANPLRLAYHANVYRAQESEGGRPAEFEQFGVELIGDATVSAEAEVISLLMSVLNQAGVNRYHITIGHIGFVQNLLQSVAGDEQHAAILRRFLYEKNYVGYGEYVSTLGLPEAKKDILLRLPRLKGGRETLREAERLTEQQIGRTDLAALDQLANILEEDEPSAPVSFDLSLVNHMDYYTGLLFEVFGENIGFPLGNGGRYNELYRQFGHETPAIGFGLRIDRMIEAIGSMEEASMPICLLYSPKYRLSAIRKAKRMREDGLQVVTQDLQAIAHVDAFIKAFSSVDYMTDETMEGRSQDG